jgi:hypothetical protein
MDGLLLCLLLGGALRLVAHIRRHLAEVNEMIQESREYQAAREYHPSRWNG